MLRRINTAKIPLVGVFVVVSNLLLQHLTTAQGRIDGRVRGAMSPQWQNGYNTTHNNCYYKRWEEYWCNLCNL